MAAETNSINLSENITSNESELAEKSLSLLPQGETQNKTTENDEVLTVEESSFEFSGYSSVTPSGGEYSSEIDDPFNDIFYRVIPSGSATHIHFFSPQTFDKVLSVLEKEFRTPGEDIKKFLLKTHVDGLRCHINVDRNDLTITATGPSHVSWKEKVFRKMTRNMVKNLMDKANENQTIPTANTSTQNTDSEIDSSSSTRQEDSSLSLESLETNKSRTLDSSPQHSITALMDKIHSLQGEINTLRTVVNKLVTQVGESQPTPDSVIIMSQTDQNAGAAKNGNVNSDINDTTHEDMVSTEVNLQQTYTVQDNVRLTSTPILPRPTWTHVVGTRQPNQSEPKPKVSKTSHTKATAKKILLMGDSIITGVNIKGLKDKVYKHGISGATVDTLLQEIEVYDLQNFSHIILYIGGNNASNGTDSEYFEEKYDQLICYIKERNRDCKIMLVNSCPRGDVDVTHVNEIMSELAEQHDIVLIDAYKAFFNKKQTLSVNYYSQDRIHLSNSGVKRLVGTINNHLDIVDNFTDLVFSGRKPTARLSPQHRSNRSSPAQRGNGAKPQPCTKCGEENHKTSDCKHVAPLQCHNCGYYGHKSRKCHPQ